jgi:hypothetical protein
MAPSKKVCWLITYTTIRVILLIICILILVYSYNAKNEGAVDVDPLIQVRRDWKDAPFVDIRVSF